MNKMYKTQNSKHGTQKGITLVALVITIIVILILAGVAINMAIDSNGLFGKANEAVERWNERIKQEETILSELFVELDQKPNAPKLGTNMIPVYYENGWKKADSKNNSYNWYQYDTTNKKWANAVTVQENSRSQYLNASIGTEIKEEDILGMFVWIPRYAYRITQGYHQDETAQLPIEGNVEIKFLKGTTDEFDNGKAVRTNVTNGENYVVHPAFTNDTTNGGGNKEVEGFWVAKFEASSNTTTGSNQNLGASYGRTNNDTDQVTVRPNVTTWRDITVTQIYQVCKNMNAEGNIHGLTSTETPHMMKNSEWGAIAYLTQSNYGNKQTNSDDTSGVWVNSYHEGDISVNTGSIAEYYTTMTGMVGSSRDDVVSSKSKAIGTIDKSNDETISITYQNYNSAGELNGSEYTKTYYRYQTEHGQKGSSTRNIYGVYDLAGGTWEYVAGYLSSGTTSYVEFFETLQDAEKQVYLGTGDSTDAGRMANFQANNAKYGDAIWETSRNDAGAGSSTVAWNDEYSHFMAKDYPFFIRGGDLSDGSFTGVFCFHYAGGTNNKFFSFRPVVGV